ncbi:hypothetical protein ACR0ST_11070 [Aliidiomarina sp. Khilg15.8]
MEYIIIIALIVAGFLFYRSQQANQAKRTEQQRSESDVKASEPLRSGPAERTEEKPVDPPEVAAHAAEAKSEIEHEVSEVAQVHAVPPVPDVVKPQAAALSDESKPLARHRLYQQITEASYKDRDDANSRTAFKYYAEQHISEFDAIKKPLKKQNNGKLPQVSTFRNLANVLVEDGEYDEAIAVCQQALSHGLKDGTKTGYQGRIERIEAKKA